MASICVIEEPANLPSELTRRPLDSLLKKLIFYLKKIKLKQKLLEGKSHVSPYGKKYNLKEFH